jgi:hypothetical protein
VVRPGSYRFGMKKLPRLFAVAALATTISLAGCKKKDEGNAASADKPAEGVKKDDKAATPTPATAGTPDKAAAPAAAGDLPAECNEYKASIEKLASCDKMPQQARDALKQAYDQASAGWANLPAEAKANLATACKAGTDAVTTSAKQVCGW